MYWDFRDYLDIGIKVLGYLSFSIAGLVFVVTLFGGLVSTVVTISWLSEPMLIKLFLSMLLVAFVCIGVQIWLNRYE